MLHVEPLCVAPVHGAASSRCVASVTEAIADALPIELERIPDCTELQITAPP